MTETTDTTDTTAPRAEAPQEGKRAALKRFIRQQPLGALGFVMMAVYVLVAVFSDLVALQDPVLTNAKLSLAPPPWLCPDPSQNVQATSDFCTGRSLDGGPVGNDVLGRDVYSRLVYGARVSLLVGLSSTFLGGVIGLVIGLLSGYLLGWTDLLFQRVMDIMQSLPLLVMALVMAAALGPSLPNTIIAISIPLIPRSARVVRSSTLSIRELPFVEAARAQGMGEMRIAFLHVLPNTLAPFIVLVTAQLGAAILTEASLSFLGLGVPEPHPSWGRMLSTSASEYVRAAPWLVIAPGVIISLAVFGINLLGDALRDTLDPRLRI